MIQKSLATGALGALALTAACANPDGTSNRTATGATIGALTGAAAGNIIGEDSRGTLIGGLVGAAAGGAIGNRLDAQARELQASIGGSGAGIVNTGSQLVVSLPEAITFDFGSDVVRSNLRDDLALVSRSLQNYPDTTVQVVGHTDNVGSASYNQSLSERRALAVTNVLIGAGAPAGRIQSYGRSFNQPAASNETEAGRAQNRRVEIIITPRA